MKVYTVYCKAPTDGRGQYSEEVDVTARTAGTAKRLAQEILESDFVAGMRAVRVEYRRDAQAGAQETVSY